MKQQIYLLAIIILIISIPMSPALESIDNSLYIDVESADFTLTLDMGAYAIIFDNSGYMGTPSDRMIDIEITITDSSGGKIITYVSLDAEAFAFLDFTVNTGAEQVTFEIQTIGPWTVSVAVAEASQKDIFVNEVVDFRANEPTSQEFDPIESNPYILIFLLLVVVVIIGGGVQWLSNNARRTEEYRPTNSCISCGNIRNSESAFCANCGTQYENQY